MKITIITPSFNQGNYLEQTIDSVLSQNYNKLEYIIIDGGSTDSSVGIIKKYEKHLTHWVSENDKGQSHAINKGLKMSTGDIVNWLNSDDYYEPGALRIISEQFTDPNVKVVSARSNIVKNGITIRQSQGTDVYIDNLAKTIGWARIDQPETFFRREFYQQVGLLNEGLNYVMDREWWMRYLFAFGLGGIKKINDTLVNFRLHDQSKTESNKMEFEKENALVFWSLANQLCFDKSKSFIEKMFLLHRKNEQTLFPNVDRQLGQQVIHYFLLLRADQEYYQLQFDTVKKILEQIETHHLSTEDQHLVRKLYFRSRYIPVGVVKTLRKWM